MGLCWHFGERKIGKTQCDEDGTFIRVHDCFIMFRVKHIPPKGFYRMIWDGVRFWHLSAFGCCLSWGQTGEWQSVK
jgi:hypothetical protein